jgi:hypothetical protein
VKKEGEEGEGRKVKEGRKEGEGTSSAPEE